MSRNRPRIISISPEFIELHEPPFEPYVLILIEPNKPSSIAMAAAGGGNLKYTPLPPNTTIDDLPRVQDMVRREHQEHKVVPLFGPTIGFFFVYKPNEGVKLGLDGEVQEGRKQGRFWPQSISIQNRI